ncbi:MAG: NAD(+)/NADH kinase [Chloroflexi bacterium]|nr:MAG: NAD(+)/NADH kinase [Chloroflexota bacterium]
MVRVERLPGAWAGPGRRGRAGGQPGALRPPGTRAAAVKVGVLHYPGLDLQPFERILRAADCEYWLHEREAAIDTDRLRNTDLMLTLGGDGTFLHGARHAAPNDVPILGVNLGRLGLLTEVDPKGLKSGLERVKKGDYRTEERTMVTAELATGGRASANVLALNEVMLHRSPSLRIIRFAMSMDGQEIGTIDADGVLVATATGSTAYSLALGGPILEPTLSDLVLVPMNPFALTVRPIVVNGVEVRVKLIGSEGSVAADGRELWTAQDGSVLTVRAYSRRLKVVRFGPPDDFYRVLRDKIGWGTPLVPRPQGVA